MQTLADVLNVPIEVASTDQACALGAAINAAVAAGLYPSVSEASEAMASGINRIYTPDNKNKGIYEEIYKKYSALNVSSVIR